MEKKVSFLTILFLSFFIVIHANINFKEVLIKSNESLEFTRNSFSDESIKSLFNSYNIIHIEAVSPMSQGFNWYLVRTEQSIDLTSLQNQAKNNNNLKAVQRNGLSAFNRIPNDPLYNDQRDMFELIKLPQAWNIETGSEQVIVAVVDSGILHLDDLINNIFINEGEIPGNGIDNDGNGFIDDYMGYDFVDAPGMAHIAIGDYLVRDPDPTDETFHGTHVSGIIGADTDNNIGITGTAWNIKILPIRAGFSTAGGGGFLEDDDAAAALLYAANMGAHIINVSWGDSNFSQIIKDAIDYCEEKGVIVVCAAGNTPGGNINYPARFNNTIAVGAVDRNKVRASFSSYGPELDIMAPGQEILSTYSLNNNYNRLSGTSMAAPFVSGAIALLLSREPGLDVFEVKQRLRSSAEDLGNEGFDIFHGYGLLNVQKLLNIESNDIAEISFPHDHQRLNSAFDIIGTVTSEHFLRYSVMFTDRLNPLSIDWKDVNNHTNSPVYFYNQVENGVLSSFYLPNNFNDNLYRLRVRLEKTDGSFIDNFIIFYIDRDSPRLVEESVFYQKRYKEHFAEHFIFSLWNKEVSLNMEYTIGTFTGIVASAVYDSIHVLQVDNLINSGILSIKFSAVDLSGNTYDTDWLNLNQLIVQEEIPNTGFRAIELENGLVLAKNTVDFNNNGRPEFVAMKTGTGITNPVYAYEFHQNALLQTYYFSEDFWPLDVYKKSNGRSKIASLRGDQIQIYESLVANNYPDLPLWNLSDVSGAIFADFNNNGSNDLLVVRNLLAEIGLELYSESGDSYQRYKVLSNPTPTSSRRMFIPKIQAGNLDNDAYTDLLTADTDGDIMIWEYIDGDVSLSWSKRIPITNVYYLNIADYTGDGQNEFLAGGYITAEQSNKTWWYFELFKSFNDNEYTSLGSISFSSVKTGENSITSIDLDGDGQHEMILALSPYLYVVKYTENGLSPVYWTNCDNSYQIASMSANQYHEALVIYNKTIEEEIRSFALIKDEPFTGPETPTNLKAFFVDNGTVKLEWNPVDADYYEVFYKLSDEDNYHFLGQSIDNDFFDSEIQDKDKIIYSVRAIHLNMNPKESYFSYPYAMFLGNLVSVDFVRMISKDALLLKFDSPVHQDCVNMRLYEVNNGVGSPSSVHFYDENKTLYLKFFVDFPLVENLQISFFGLKDINGRDIIDSVYNFDYIIDTTPPFVVDILKISDSQFSLIFSELLDIDNAMDKDNYYFEYPASDSNIKISEVVAQDSTVTITLDREIGKTNQNYYLVMRNIKDLAGNKISSLHNRISLNLTELRDLSLLVVYPNPLNLNNSDKVRFENLPNDKKGEIKIFNMAGELIYKKDIVNEKITEWDAKNQKGKSIAGGLYYYIISYDNDTKTGKLAVIR